MFNNGVAVIACHECDGNLSLMHHAESSSASRRHAFHAFQGSCIGLHGCLEYYWTSFGKFTNEIPLFSKACFSLVLGKRRLTPLCSALRLSASMLTFYLLGSFAASQRGKR